MLPRRGSPWLDDEATDASIVEVRAADTIGLLYRLASALESCAVDVRAARLSSLGPAAVDAFYVVPPAAPDVDRARARIEAALRSAAT